jgi:hypothetical protein
VTSNLVSARTFSNVNPKPSNGIRVLSIASSVNGHCFARVASVLFLGWVTIAIGGCGTTTKRVATEQLLMSTAVDDAIAKIDFSHLTDQKVYLDPTFLRAIRSAGFVNADYVTSALRQQLTAAGCLLQDKQDQADTIVEARVGALGTDGHEIIYGIPKTGGISAAASAISSTPIAAIPEVSFAQTNAQSGVAKIIVFAYDRETREPLWQSGVATAESDSTNTWVLGAGPFQKGSIYDGRRFAGRRIEAPLGLTHKKGRWIRDDATEENDALSYRDAFAFESILEDDDLLDASETELAENVKAAETVAEAVAEAKSPEKQTR